MEGAEGGRTQNTDVDKGQRRTVGNERQRKNKTYFKK